MHTLTLPGTDVTATRLGFGCGRLMRIPNKRGRENVIAAALDAGITYFDVAPMYGMGSAEAELARCLGNRRHDVTIATKFGLDVRAGVFSYPLVQGVARRVLNMVPGLKNAVRRNSDRMIKPKKYDVNTAVMSFNRSLAALDIDQVGVLLMHEPAPADINETELLPWFELMRDSGKIGSWGVAGVAVQTARILESMPALAPVIQFDCDALNRQIERMPAHENHALVSYSPMFEVLDRIKELLYSDPILSVHWSTVTGEDFSRPETVARFLLAYAVRANPDGVVLYSTSSPRRIEQASQWVDSPEPGNDALQAFLALLDEVFSPGPGGRA